MTFTRLQCTPDLAAEAIVGSLEHPGPVFTNLLLVDEINRGQPRTQAALLEAMAEGQVTLSGQSLALPTPFLVLATQNPLEMAGTYPLPEAQRDRFLFQLLVGYPTRAELREIVARTTQPVAAAVPSVTSAADLLRFQHQVRACVLPPSVQDYIAGVILATHPDQREATPLVRRYVLYGASPRGAQSLALGGKAMAWLAGRAVVTISDVQSVVIPSLQHRVILNFEGMASGIVADSILHEVLRMPSDGVAEYVA